MYRLRAKVELSDRPDLAVAAVFGRDAPAVLGLSPEPGCARAYRGGIALVDPRLAALGARLVVGYDAMARIAAEFTAGEFSAYDRHRLRLGVPDGSRDLVPEKSILLESGFDELHGVDWNKGCYVGQELTARTKYRGLIKKRLFPVSVVGAAPEPGTPVFADGKDAGEMRSSCGSLGLALLRLDAVATRVPLSSGGAVLAPLRPDWMRLAADDEQAAPPA